jgi:hypothetical protein
LEPLDKVSPARPRTVACERAAFRKPRYRRGRKCSTHIYGDCSRITQVPQLVRFLRRLDSTPLDGLRCDRLPSYRRARNARDSRTGSGPGQVARLTRVFTQASLLRP